MKRNKIALRDRRKSALERLKTQLNKGIKMTSEGALPLTSNDISRINQEIATLGKRIAK